MGLHRGQTSEKFLVILAGVSLTINGQEKWQQGCKKELVNETIFSFFYK